MVQALTSSAQTIPRDGRVHPSLVKAEKKKSVLSLFKLGMGSKFWNEKVMGRGKLTTFGSFAC